MLPAVQHSASPGTDQVEICLRIVCLLLTFFFRVDFFSLDIEGAEMGVLRTIPWHKVDIEVFLIEVRADRESILSANMSCVSD